MWKSDSFPAADPDVDLAAIAEASRPFAELCPAEHGAATVQGLCLAHMDAHLLGSAAAAGFLADEVASAFASRGIDVELA
ncbi:MAG: hypothetical protein ABFS41_06655 [Myxococcota bacterium]